jgi:hypothetical protein
MAQLKVYIDHTGITRIFVDDERVDLIAKLDIRIHGDDPLPSVSISLPNTDSGRRNAAILAKIPYVDVDYVEL